MGRNEYTYEISFSNDGWMPWHWTVLLNGKPIERWPREYTGSAAYSWSAHWLARKYIRRHNRHRGKTFGGQG